MVDKIKKLSYIDLIKQLESSEAQIPQPLKEAKDLKCNFFKKFLALEAKKNEQRRELFLLK